MNRQLAFIGGSQAHQLLMSKTLTGERIAPITTPFGESQPIYKLKIGDPPVLFLPRHGEKGYEITALWVNYRANIWALENLGAQQIIAWSGPAAMDESMKIGQFVVPDDLVDETKLRPQSFFEKTGCGFIRQNPVFCPELTSQVVKALQDLNLEHKVGGTYVCTEGPRLETPAEIRKYKLFGGDLVGMTLAPEVFLAKELELCYTAICYVTNYAEGIRERPFVPGVLFEGLLDESEKEFVDKAVDAFPEIIAAIAGQPQAPLSCSCGKLMERYRRRGNMPSV